MNNYGQLGDGTTTSRRDARRVEGLPPVARVRAGVNTTCALTVAGDVYCWGVAMTSFTSPSLPLAVPLPTQVKGFAGKVADLSPAGDGACAVLVDGRVQCWGSSSIVPFGTKTPVTIDGITDATSISVYSSACATTKTGEMFCWGEGLLGDGTEISTSTPRKVLW